MKKIALIGVNHFSPLIAKILQEELEELNLKNGIPQFVAVEYGEEIFKQLNEQRKCFECLIDAGFSWLSEADRNLIKLSYCYEANMHLQIWGNSTSTVWLDKDRELSKDEEKYIFGYADIRYEILRQYSKEGDSLEDIHKELDRISSDTEFVKKNSQREEK